MSPSPSSIKAPLAAKYNIDSFLIMSHSTEVEAWGPSWRFVSRIRVDIDHVKKHGSAMSKR